MHPRQMIAFAIIFDGELPVAVDLKLERRLFAAMIKRTPSEIVPTFCDRADEVLKRWGLAIQIDEYHVHPNGRPHFKQTEFGRVDVGMGVYAGPTDVRRRA